MAITKEEAKEKVKELVKEFSHYTREELNNKSEDQIRAEFIDPLFEALGWDMRKDAQRNQSVLKGRADYILKLKSQNVVVIEAKKTSVSLMEEEGRQAVEYAYNSNIKFAILTNFKQTRVYHALSNIKNIDHNLLKKDNAYFRLGFEEFLDKFDLLWLLSKESFERQEINKLLSAKDERINVPVNERLLNDLLNFRDWLSKDLKKLRMHLSDQQIDEIVQILIDRLIFMRSVEDRGLEERDFLKKLVDDYEKGKTEKRIWETLKIKFKIFDKEYNSKLFEEGLLEKEGFFDDDTLKKLIRGLYYGTEDHQGRYLFDAIPGDLLGNIYEQYLGTILQGTEKRVKLDSESGKRKKMGIYYTPSYIVDYIVKNTVGEYIKDKTIDEILEVRIVDPACGSGSFLIRAFREVCDVIEEKLKKGENGKDLSFKFYKDRLTLIQKSAILQRCIYGVDLDEKAVELAQLNLLLKLLEEETPETRRRILPLMKENIKCGNSLIDDTSVSDKAFNWHAQFKDVFSGGGFDIVIGNPPYGAELPEKDREILEKKFSLGNTDTACLFMALAVDLLKKDGINGFIIPKPFVYSSTWKGIRQKLLSGLTEIVDCGKVWKEVKLEQVIYFYYKNKSDKIYRSCVRENQEIKCVGNIGKETFKEFGFLLNGISDEELKLGRKIKSVGTSLNDFITNQRGAIYQKEVVEKLSDFKVLGGAQIGRYLIHQDIKGYISKKIVVDEKAYIKDNSLLVQRLVAHIENPIDHIKITASLSKDLEISEFIIVDTINQLQNKGKVSSEYLIAIINSKLTNWYAYRFIFGKAIRTMQFDNPVTERIIIPKVAQSQEKKIISLVNQMLELQKKYHDEKITGGEKERLKQQIDNIDYEIDQEVYKLYSITSEEQKVIEENFK
jgi:predicted RNA methylase